MDNEKYIRKWLEGSLNDEEKKRFEASPEFKSLKKLNDALRALQAPEYNVEEELARLNLSKKGKGKSVNPSWLQPMLRIAAVLVVIIGAFFYFYLTQSTDIRTAAAEKTNLYLPDSSHVTMNAFTNLSYKERLWNYNRSLKLDGEAYFDVAKGSKFDVRTTSGIVSVYGTQFNVKIRENYFEVVCYEGLVKVERSEGLTQLPAGSSLRVVNGIVEKNSQIDDISPSWLQNVSEFRSVPYIQVIKEFERQYNVKILAPAEEMDQLFTGKFVHNNRNLALQSISAPLNLKIEVNDKNQIILSGQGD